MSELITKHDRHTFIRWKLLTSASLLALAACVSARSQATDPDTPQVWIELGGQLSSLSGEHEPLIPHFSDVAMQHGLTLPLAPLEAHAKHSLDDEGSISLQPKSSSWIFSISVRYGRSNTQKQHYQQLDPVFYTINAGAFQYPGGPGRGEPHGTKDGHITFGPVPIVDYHAQTNESHEILDFQAGKDVGVGLFGRGSTSKISVGVRFAQLTSKTKLKLYADPYPHMSHKKYIAGFGNFYQDTYDQYYKASPTTNRSFHGLGPTLSWTGSAPVVNLGEDANIDFDWGINGGLLFGKQKTLIAHQTSGTTWYRHAFPTAGQAKYGTSHYVHNTNMVRSRSVTVPNVGGMAGLSLQFPNAKISVGYRADFFFGAMDGGIDQRRSETVGYYGPFATISIGLGG